MKFGKFLNELNEDIVTQEEVKHLIKKAPKERFTKNAIAAVVQTNQLTDKQKSQIGSIDKATYSKEYFEQNPYVIIQAKKDGTVDMYNPKASIIENNYKEVKPNDQILQALKKIGIDKTFIDKFVIKTQPTMMAKAEDVGLEGKKIEAPWGGTQDAQKGSYVVDGDGEVYIINPDNNGLPIGYVKA